MIKTERHFDHPTLLIWREAVSHSLRCLLPLLLFETFLLTIRLVSFRSLFRFTSTNTRLRTISLNKCLSTTAYNHVQNVRFVLLSVIFVLKFRFLTWQSDSIFDLFFTGVVNFFRKIRILFS